MYIAIGSYCKVNIPELGNDINTTISLQWPQRSYKDLVIIGANMTFQCDYPQYVANDAELTCTGPHGNWTHLSGDYNIYPHCLGMSVILVKLHTPG